MRFKGTGNKLRSGKVIFNFPGCMVTKITEEIK